MNPAIKGLTMPGMVAIVFVIPINIEAYEGAMSKWLTPFPKKDNAPNAGICIGYVRRKH